MDDTAYNAMKERIDNLTLQVIQLKRANLNLKRQLKQERRKYKKLNDEQAKKQKQFYKNGKRGGKFNG
jgi:predicted RNase H-like nuclease (RuvC/YqgF family)